MFPVAAVINYHDLGGINHRNLLSYCYGGQRSKIKFLGLFSSRGSEGQSVPCSIPSFLWQVVILDMSLQSLLLSPYCLLLSLCFCVSNLPFLLLIRTLVLDLGSILNLQWSHLKSNYILKDSIFKIWLHHCYQGLAFGDIFWGDKIQPTIQHYSKHPFHKQALSYCLHRIQITFSNSNLLAYHHDIQKQHTTPLPVIAFIP